MVLAKCTIKIGGMAPRPLSDAPVAMEAPHDVQLYDQCRAGLTPAVFKVGPREPAINCLLPFSARFRIERLRSHGFVNFARRPLFAVAVVINRRERDAGATK
jgi:hypothetical protein